MCIIYHSMGFKFMMSLMCIEESSLFTCSCTTETVQAYMITSKQYTAYSLYHEFYHTILKPLVH